MKQIYLFGVVGEDFTAASVVKELSGDVEIHINSAGGDVFEGLAIYNLLKKHVGRVEVVIDGLCASAASLIACAGDSVKMAANALFMVHNPATILSGAFEAEELAKFQDLLGTLKESLLTTYEAKTGKARGELEKLVDAETWLSADEAQALGFVDEITDAVEATYDAAKKILFVNKIKVEGQRFDFEKLAAAVGAVAQEGQEMAEIDVAALKAEAILAERTRIKNLTALKCDNAAVNAIIDLAVEDGKELAEIQNYIDAVKIATPNKPAAAPSTENAVAERICAMIRDNLKSGAEGVEGAAPAKDEKVAQTEMLARFTNEALKRGAVR